GRLRDRQHLEVVDDRPLRSRSAPSGDIDDAFASSFHRSFEERWSTVPLASASEEEPTRCKPSLVPGPWSLVPAFYPIGSRSSGMVIHRGPPRARDSSWPAKVTTVRPWPKTSTP